MDDPARSTEERIDDKAAPVEASSSSTGFRQAFSSLGLPAYRNLWIGMLFQLGALQMGTLTRGFLVYELTDSSTLLGIVGGVGTIPILSLGLIAGVLADRLDKRRIIQASQLLALVIALALGVLITTGMITWVHLLIASVGQGVVMTFSMPARQAIIPQIVEAERLTNAVALNSMGFAIVSVAGPGLAGVLIAVIGVEGVYYLMAGMYGVAILLTQVLPRLQNASGAERRTLLEELVDGLRYVRATRQVVMVLVLAFATFLFVHPLRSILPVFAKDVFGVGSGGLGAMISAIGIGSLIGALAVAGSGKAQRRGLRLLLVSLLSGSVLLGFSLMSSFAPGFWLALGFLLVLGASVPTRMILVHTLLLEYTAPQFRGRVMSLFFLGGGLVPAAAIPLGVLTDAIGAPAAVTVLAVVALSFVAVLFLASPVLRRIR